jgi:hypothetical protein
MIYQYYIKIKWHFTNVKLMIRVNSTHEFLGNEICDGWRMNGMKDEDKMFEELCMGNGKGRVK